MATTFYIVPHTHWDREWYSPFQTFRARLVEMVDELLPILENDPGFRHFMLDGQMAAVDDYLEIRPETESRIRELIAEGRLVVGPWQILMDEFLVSGENTIRNLRKGLARAAELGEAMPVGYMPDTFGHVSQMPQILSKAGMKDALVWRGVPKAVNRTLFTWYAPDGSSVRTAYLATSYGNGAQLPGTADALDSRADYLQKELAPFEPGDSLLVMNGSDHLKPQPKLPSLLAELNARGDDRRFLISTLAEYLKSMPAEATEEWTGELRSSARANLLMGVTSNRVDIRRQAAFVENRVERYAEPLATLYGRGEHQRMLDLAWDRLIDNAAHDSICACSVDEVTTQVVVRFNEAEQLAEAVVKKAMKTLARRVEAEHGIDLDSGEGAADGDARAGDGDRESAASKAASESAQAILAFNPGGAPRSEVTIFETAIPDDWETIAVESPSGTKITTQELEKVSPVLIDLVQTGRQLAAFGPLLGGRQVMEYWINGVEYDENERTVTVNADTVPRGQIDVESEKEKFAEFCEAHLDEQIHITALRPGMRKLACKLPAVPPLGWGAFRPVKTVAAELSPMPSDLKVKRDGRVLESKDLRLEVNDDGTVNLLGENLVFSNGGRIVDGGEWGDTYNYSPPATDSLVAEASEVTITEGFDGPVVASIEVRRRFALPVACEPDGSRRSASTIDTEIIDSYELRTGEPYVRVTTRFENQSRDHRMRVHFPMPFEAQGSDAGTPFDVVHRGLEAEGGPSERGLATYPARGFVDVSGSQGGLAILIEPVTEYEVVDGELAITLVRANGMLSQRAPSLRPEPAGPTVAAPLAQCLGEHEWKYALYPHKGDWVTGNVLEVSEQFCLPLEVGDAAPIGASVVFDSVGLELKGAQLSACYRDNGRPIFRFWGSRAGGHARLRHPSVEVDILGRMPETVPEAQPEFEVGPFEIKTIAIT